MNVAVFSATSYEAVQKVYAEAKSHLGEILSAFEFWDKQAVSVRWRDGEMAKWRGGADNACAQGILYDTERDSRGGK